MPTELLYITGPTTNYIEQSDRSNVENIFESALRYHQLGYDIISFPPNVLSHTKRKEDKPQFLEEQKELIRQCDGIVLCEGWENDEICKDQLMLATQKGLKIFFSEKKSPEGKEKRESSIYKSKISSGVSDLLTYSPTTDIVNRWILKKHPIPIWIETDHHSIRISNKGRPQSDIPHNTLRVEIYGKGEKNPVSVYEWDDFESSRSQKDLKKEVDKYKESLESVQETARNALLEVQGLMERRGYSNIVSCIYDSINISYPFKSGLTKTILELINYLDREEARELIQAHAINTLQAHVVLEYLDLEDRDLEELDLEEY